MKDIEFVISKGEYVGLVGVNGAGKTTLIKVILDFISVDKGRIEIFGRSHKETSARKALSFLPERFLPPHYLTGQNFLAYMAELNSVQLKDKDIKRIFEVLDLDISALKKFVRQYSKGMAQKLGLAASLLSQRPMLVFDEPMSSLDPKARAYLKRYLPGLKEQQVTLFFTTHLLADIDPICDRIIILHEGRLRFNGSPEQCCERYQTTSLEEAYLRCIGEA